APNCRSTARFHEFIGAMLYSVSRGKDAVVTVGYAESLYLPAAPGSRSREKGNRNEVEGKQFIGARDQFIPDGGSRRTFRPLWWRAYRYVELIPGADELFALNLV